MTTSLVLTTIIIILLIVILMLLTIIYFLNKKNNYVDEANMWHKLAVTDDLTGIYNRNAYNLYVEENKANTKKESRWIILFDVDDFKIINDTKGHLAGDLVLKNVAKLLSEIFSSRRPNGRGQDRKRRRFRRWGFAGGTSSGRVRDRRNRRAPNGVFLADVWRKRSAPRTASQKERKRRRGRARSRR